jgi:hypothetical protein
MQKVIWNRFWVMSGRWQALTLPERPLERPRIVEKAWFRSIYAPYWRGAGVGLTVGPYSLRFGTCTKGLDVEESFDEFDWAEFGAGFDEHLEASLFVAGEDNIDAHIGEAVEPELVTAFIDLRTNQLTAIVHEGGEVEYVERKVIPLGQAVQSP